MVRAVQSNRKNVQSSVSVSKLHIWMMRGLGATVAIFWHCTKRGAWTVESTGADWRAVASCKQTFKKVHRIGDFKKKIISKTVARHNSEYCNPGNFRKRLIFVLFVSF